MARIEREIKKLGSTTIPEFMHEALDLDVKRIPPQRGVRHIGITDIDSAIKLLKKYQREDSKLLVTTFLYY